MPGDSLLDTNIVIALFADDRKIQRKLKRSTVYMASIVVGELMYGALKSARVQDNLKRIEDFAHANTVLACDLDTARSYGHIKQQLRSRGKPLPENDIGIAALARQHDLTLVSRDAHFQEVGDLKLEIW
jgi:tRNA(fMet)-specific endonuclease VapC